jgi:hypothetical protein
VDYLLCCHIFPEEIAVLLAAGDFTGLKKISQHPIRNAFYDGVCLGGNRCGIHGMMSAELLHLLELDLFKYTIECFCVALGCTPKSKIQPKILKEIIAGLLPLVGTWATKATGDYLAPISQCCNRVQCALETPI